MYTKAIEVTPSNGTDLAEDTRGIYIGGSGSLKVDVSDGSNVTTVILFGLAVGVVHPLAVRRIYENDTTATNIVALY